MAHIGSTTAKKGPTVLVGQQSRFAMEKFHIDIDIIQVQDPRPSRPQDPRRQTSRFITVDSVLQYASDIPSMQQRQPQKPRISRTGSGKPMNPALTGRFLPPHMPPRSTKLSEKLVLLPESVEEVDEKGEFGQDDDIGPPKDDEEYRRPGREKSKSYAERLPKARRTEKELARVTAYCTAQAYKMQTTTAFIKDRHIARTKLYDDCLYAAYHLPLLPGSEGYRIQSSPALKRPGGKTLLDEAIERSEQMDYHGAYFAEDEEQHSVRGSETSNEASSPGKEQVLENGHRRGSDYSRRSISPTQSNFLADAFRFAEMFIFSYGVVVFWNFTEKQEKRCAGRPHVLVDHGPQDKHRSSVITCDKSSG